MKIYLGADHRGINLKEKVKDWLSELGMQYEDLGATTFNQDDDYPEYALKVAEKIKNDPNALGIVICGSGVGVNIVANKIDGVRAAIAVSDTQIQAGRRDDNVNVLALAADFLEDNLAKRIVEVFLSTPFEENERHLRRLNQIAKIEDTN